MNIELWRNQHSEDWTNDTLESADLIKLLSIVNIDQTYGHIILHRVLQKIKELDESIQYLPIILKLYQKTQDWNILIVLDWAANLNPDYFKLFYLLRTDQISKNHYNTIWVGKVLDIENPIDRRVMILSFDLDQILLYWMYWFSNREDFNWNMKYFVAYQSFLPHWNEINYIQSQKPIANKRIYIDMDDTLCQYKQRYQAIKKENPNIEWPQSIPGFFKDLDPIHDAIQSVKILAEKNEIWFLTRPSIKNLHCYTEKAEWIQKWFGEEWLERLIISSNKSLLIGDILIDDSIHHKNNQFKGIFFHFKQIGWSHVLRTLVEPI